jgi:hypothetical protein
MIAKTRAAVVDAVGLLLALISLGCGALSAAALILFLWRAVFDGGLIKPLAIGAVAFLLAIVTRFLATLDQYEYAPPAKTTTTTRTQRSGNTTRRTTTAKKTAPRKT